MDQATDPTAQDALATAIALAAERIRTESARPDPATGAHAASFR